MADHSEYFKQQWPLLQQADLLLPLPNLTFDNPPFEEASFRVLIVRLSPFRDVDRSTPHLFLFQAVRRTLPDAYIDFAFFPPIHDRSRLLSAGIPLLFGIQSFRSVQDFDLVLISNAYTLELINLPYLLINSHIPLLASQRDNSWPPLILGGSNAMASQAIVTETGDSLVDGIFVGEGEIQVTNLVRSLSEDSSESKAKRLSRAADCMNGLWVTGKWPQKPVEKAVLPKPDASHLLVDYPVLNGQEASTARLQINYGCPAFCSFCFESYDRKPYREVNRAAILEAAQRLKKAQGCDTLEIYSFNLNTHREMLALLLELNRLFDRVSFMSQRIDVLHSTPGMLEAEVAADKRNFTLGVEGISERMRSWLHKSLATDQVTGVLDRLLRQKIRSIKLFYILTGHEDESDLGEFREFVHQLKDMRQRHNPGIRIVFSFGMLVRMPFTPLRYDRLMLDPKEWKGLVGPIKSACETTGFEFRLAVEWDEYSASQVLALGGYWMWEPLVELASAGFCYDERLPDGYWDRLRGWMESNSHWTEEFVGEKPKEYDYAFSFVRSNVPSKFLYRKYEHAKACVDEGYCLGSHDSLGRCLGCDACQSDDQRDVITGHRIDTADNSLIRSLEKRVRIKRQTNPSYVHVRLPAEVTGASADWLNSWLMRKMLSSHPALVDNLLAVQESLFSTRENLRRYGPLYGETIIALRAWNADEVLTTLVQQPSLGGLAILGMAEGFEPGRFSSMQFNMTLPVDWFPDVGGRLRDFLRGIYVPCNLRREGRGYRVDLPKKALKKKVLFDGEFEEVDGQFKARLVVGPKFDLLGFLRSFPQPERYRNAEVVVSALKWS
jgi:radical SAM superfamily enzyme YgiQ (UPF0313 family)